MLERLAASLGQLDGVAPRFEHALDIPNGGVLFALPALLVSGLLRHATHYFQLPPGFYGLEMIFLLLAFMALARLKSIEALRYCAPGEWGKLLGLDRVPEVRTLRAKLKHLAEQQQAFAWSTTLCQEWMATSPEAAAILYVDGHVRVYHGSQTHLPKHYVARERLCLRATADYWVNAMDGQPFFVVSQAVDPGLLKVLDETIVPRLEKDVPGQPSEEALAADPLRHRFTLVFDREGYSPAFIMRMKEKRIACLTYHKHPGEDWPEDEFMLTPTRLLGRGGHDDTGRARDLSGRTGVGARDPQADREWPSNGRAQHRLLRRHAAPGDGDVRPLVSGKLLPLYAPALQFGQPGGLPHRNYS
jgi:hypothetical protein